MCLCVRARLFLACRSILFLFAKAIRKHYLDCSMLELTVWIYGVLGLDFFTKSLQSERPLPALLQPPLKWSPKRFLSGSLCCTQEAGGTNRAVTGLPQMVVC